MENILLLIPVTFVIGFLAAIPLGAVQVEVAKRSLKGYLKQAILIAAGSASSDLFYGFVAVFGVAPFLEEKKLMAFFWLAGAAVLSALAFMTLKKRGTAEERLRSEAVLASGNISFLLGFSLAVTNPMTLFWWLICAEILKDLGLSPVLDKTTSILFIVSGALGLGSYLAVLAVFLSRAGKYISKRREAAINAALGVLLALLALYFLTKALIVLL